MKRLLLAGASAAAVLVTPGLAVADPGSSCPSYNAPNTLMLTSGTPQSSRLGAPFASGLEVTVANTNGCPITTPLAGIAVTFAAPGTGPSGTFSSSGSNAALVGTNSQGTAMAPAFTANTLPGGYLVTASSDYGSVVFSLVNTASGVSATISPAGGSGQSTTVGAQYGAPLQVAVVDATGAPVGGATVTFSVGQGAGGSAAPGATFAGGAAQATAVTDANGLARSPGLKANGVAGRFTASASTEGVVEPAVFALDNLAGKPPTVALHGVGSQSATAGARFPDALAVVVRSAAGRPLQGQTVTFVLGSGGAATEAPGATFVGGSTQATATTNAAGVAVSPLVTAGSTAGRFTAVASVAGAQKPVTFELVNLAATPPTLRLHGPGAQSARAGSRYPHPLEAVVRDAAGHPVQGTTVTFALGSGASFVGGSPQATAVTDAAGLAVSPLFTAGSTPGRFTAVASVAGVTRPVTFKLENLAAPPSTLKLHGPAAQSATAGSRYPHPLEAIVRDAAGHPVQGATVTFALGSGASFVGGSPQATAVTGVGGIAVSPLLTAGSTPGRFTATASMTGVVRPVVYTLQNLPGRPSSLVAYDDPAAKATVETRFADRLRARILDGSGRPVAGATVTFALGAGGGASGSTGTAGATFAGGTTQATALTNGNGVAVSPALTANGVAGSYAATATTTAVSGALTFDLRNVAGKPATVTPGAATGETATVGSPFPVRPAVVVTDTKGNAVPGALVTFSAPARGPSGRFAGHTRTVRVKTDSHGIAVAPSFRANDVAGGYAVRASVPGARPAGFALVNLPRA